MFPEEMTRAAEGIAALFQVYSERRAGIGPAVRRVADEIMAYSKADAAEQDFLGGDEAAAGADWQDVIAQALMNEVNGELRRRWDERQEKGRERVAKLEDALEVAKARAKTAVSKQAKAKAMKDVEKAKAALEKAQGDAVAEGQRPADALRFSLRGRATRPADLPDHLADVVTSTTIRVLRGQDEPEFDGDDAPGDLLYKRAKKRGDDEAAVDVVERALAGGGARKNLPKLLERLRPGVPVVLVPVQQPDGSPLFNRIPRWYAERLARDFRKKGFEVEVTERIVKASGHANTGVGQVERARNEIAFDGEVEAVGRQFVIVDDVQTSGDTLIALLDHLAAQGADVRGLTALAASRYGSVLRPTAESLAAFLEKAGLTREEFTDLTGRDPGYLTQAEVRAFLLVRGSSESGRSRVSERFGVAGASGRGGSEHAPDHEGTGSQGPSAGPLLDQQPKFSLRPSVDELRNANALRRGESADFLEAYTTDEPQDGDLFGTGLEATRRPRPRQKAPRQDDLFGQFGDFGGEPGGQQTLFSFRRRAFSDPEFGAALILSERILRGGAPDQNDAKALLPPQSQDRADHANSFRARRRTCGLFPLPAGGPPA